MLATCAQDDRVQDHIQQLTLLRLRLLSDLFQHANSSIPYFFSFNFSARLEHVPVLDFRMCWNDLLRFFLFILLRFSLLQRRRRLHLASLVFYLTMASYCTFSFFTFTFAFKHFLIWFSIRGILVGLNKRLLFQLISSHSICTESRIHYSINSGQENMRKKRSTHWQKIA